MKYTAALFLFAGLALILLPFFSFVRIFGDGQSWQAVLHDPKTFSAIGFTVLIALLTLCLTVLLGTPAAEVLARSSFTGKGFTTGLLMAPFVIPGFITSMGIHHIFIKLHIVDTIWGVVLIHCLYSLPYYIRVLISGYQTFSEDYELMGWVFGAGKYRRFASITLPQILPSVLVGSSLVIIVSFAQYLNTFIIGGGTVVTLPILMFPYISSGHLGISSVYGTFFILVNLALIVVTEVLISRISKRKSKEGLYD